MTALTALRCPKCQRGLDASAWRDGTGGTCRLCQTEFEFFPFPALTAAPVRVAAREAEVAEDSVCFFHAENRAERVCEECGRLLCPVCTVNFSGRKICPSCIAGAKTAGAAPAVRERALYDSTALSLAVLPLLAWPVTLVTAPAALGFVIFGWNKPGSLVRKSGRTRLIIAALLAVVQIVAWVVLFTFLAQKR